VSVLRLQNFVVRGLALGSLAFGACERPRANDAGAATAAAPTKLRDDFGQEIVPGPPPSRIVSLNPTTTELLFAIGAGNRLVGRTHYDLWPDSAKLVADLGPGIRPNIEAVVGTHPDLVLLYGSADNRAAADRLKEAGIRELALKIDRIEEFRRATRILGVLVGDTVRARNVVDSVDRTLERVRSATATQPRVTVFFHSWEKPLITLGGGSFMSELVTIAGGRNIYDSLPGPSSTVTLEDVVRLDPDVVLTHPAERQRMLASDRWRGLRAVREGRVLAYDTNLVARPSVKLGEAAVWLAQLLHPGVVR
jgi:ABC-type Fe3+-hydroxamate transport system substrate-binding protein